MFIDDAALKAAEALEAARVLGGEDLLDIRAGESTLSPQTVALLNAKRQYSVDRLAWIRRVLALHDESVTNGYIDRKVFDVPPEVAEELEARLMAMADFAGEFREILIGADTLVVTERKPIAETRVAENAVTQPQAKKAKK